MTCTICPKEDRAGALAADSRRQIDAAWQRMRLLYLQAHTAGVDIGDEQLRDHFFEQQFVHGEYDARHAAAMDSFHSWVVTNVHLIDNAIAAGMDSGEAWEKFTTGMRRRWPRHPASEVSMADCRDTARKRFDKLVEDCPPPDDPADPYGTPPLLGVEWTEKVTGRRVAS